MTTENDLPPSAEACRDQLQQLSHDIWSHLAVVSMGLQALKGAREEPDALVELCTSIEADGVEPLKKLVARIVDLASEASESQ